MRKLALVLATAATLCGGWHRGRWIFGGEIMKSASVALVALLVSVAGAGFD
jgi:hypothetical protein